MGTQHFSKGVVRGTVQSLKDRKTKSKNKRPYGDMLVHCPSQLYGDITVRVRMWGAAYPVFKTQYKKHPHLMYKFSGHVGQIPRRGDNLFSFNAYNFEAFVVAVDDEPRASFIMEGLVVENSEKVMELNHVREEGKYPLDLNFIFPPAATPEGADPGDRITVYGHMTDLRARWGGSGVCLPVIEDIEIRERNAHAEG